MSRNHKVYVLDPYHHDAISLLQDDPNVKPILPNDPKKSSWHTDANGILLRSESRLTASDFTQAKKLRGVVKQGVGVDNIDLEAAKQHGIAVHNTPALNSEAVAELCMALTLALRRRVCEVDRLIRNGEKVVRSNVLGMSMFCKTVGVVGMGNIGKDVAQKWIGAFECSVLGFDPIAPKDAWSDVPHMRVGSLEEVLERSDVVTLHVPLLDSTRGMIGEKELRLMKKNAILVNCARGGIVDEKALLDILRETMIWGAALDATEVEPPTLEAYGEFLKCGNLIMTPHVGASTIENQSKSRTKAVETLLKVLNGEEAAGKLV